MQRSPAEAAAAPPPSPLDNEGELRRRAEADWFDLFLGNLGVEVDEAFLTRLFSGFASFVPGSARVKREPDGTTRCYGYVTFSERRDTEAAMAELDGRPVGTARGPVRLSCTLRNAEARGPSQEQLRRERLEMWKRMCEEHSRRFNEEN